MLPAIQASFIVNGPSLRQAAARTRRGGFTLVEILIVILVLGILAAIVIPQFSNATEQTRTNSLLGQLKEMRGQILLYKVHHGDVLPDLVTYQWDPFLLHTNYAGALDNTATGIYGPYVNKAPINPLNGSSTVAAAAGAGVGWVYNATDGTLNATNYTPSVLFDEVTLAVQ
jgi:general secretion pathway protein G